MEGNGYGVNEAKGGCQGLCRKERKARMRSKRKLVPSMSGIRRPATLLSLLSVLPLLVMSFLFGIVLHSIVTFHVCVLSSSRFPPSHCLPLSSTFKLFGRINVVGGEVTKDSSIVVSEIIQLQSTFSRGSTKQEGDSFDLELFDRVLLTQSTRSQHRNVASQKFLNDQMQSEKDLSRQIMPLDDDLKPGNVFQSDRLPSEGIHNEKASLQQIMPVSDIVNDEHVLRDGLQKNWIFLNDQMQNAKTFEQIMPAVDDLKNEHVLQNELQKKAEDNYLATVIVQNDIRESKENDCKNNVNANRRPNMQSMNLSAVISAQVVQACASTHFLLKQGELDGPPENATLRERLQWLKVHWSSFGILHSDDLSAQFSRRMTAFLRGQSGWNPGGGAKSMDMHHSLINLKRTYIGNATIEIKHEDEYYEATENLQERPVGPCRIRFFMTWISSLGSFGPREHLSIESLFRSHPSACLVIISRTLDSQHGRILLQPFVEKGFRVVAISPNFSSLLRNTPALKWFEELKKGKIDPGIISFGQNLSNLLRLAILYKYGGIYIDIDVIFLNDVSHLHNAIGAQSMDRESGEWKRLNNAVMAFDRKHPLLLKFIQEFSLTFNGSKWGHNGPYLVSRVVNRVSARPGYGCKVLPPTIFYPVDWEHIWRFFRAARNDSERRWQVLRMQCLQGSSLAIHMWNKQSRHLEIEQTSIMDMVFQKICIFCDAKVLEAALRPQA